MSIAWQPYHVQRTPEVGRVREDVPPVLSADLVHLIIENVVRQGSAHQQRVHEHQTYHEDGRDGQSGERYRSVTQGTSEHHQR